MGGVTLVLIRGLPGSGKSTLAQHYATQGYCHIEADMFFIGPDGTYAYDADAAVRAIALAGDRRAQQWILEQKKIAE